MKKREQLCYPRVQNFVAVHDEVHEQHPQLLSAGTQVVMAAERLRGSHLEINRIHLATGRLQANTNSSIAHLKITQLLIS